MVIHIMKNIEKLYLLVASAAATTAVLLMLNRSIFGETTTGIATVLTIIALTLFANRRRIHAEDAIQKATI
jgi:hypothetical protein